MLTMIVHMTQILLELCILCGKNGLYIQLPENEWDQIMSWRGCLCQAFRLALFASCVCPFPSVYNNLLLALVMEE